MVQKKYITFTLAAFLWGLTVSAPAATGPHGGQTRPLVSREHSVLPGYSVELVEQSPPGSKRKKFQVFVLKPDATTLNLMGSGYWAVFWYLDGKKNQLKDNLKEEKQEAWKKEPSSPPLYSFLAWGDVPKDPNLWFEVVIALPSKGGTGVAVFKK